MFTSSNEVYCIAGCAVLMIASASGELQWGGEGEYEYSLGDEFLLLHPTTKKRKKTSELGMERIVPSR